jgi:PAS domain S-box-containing protein
MYRTSIEYYNGDIIGRRASYLNEYTSSYMSSAFDLSHMSHDRKLLPVSAPTLEDDSYGLVTKPAARIAKDDAREQRRLDVLQSYQLLDTEPDPECDEITRLAARLLNAPIAMISLVDRDRQWFKSSVGVDIAETDRVHAFCEYAMYAPGVMVVEDATQDPRFCSNPMVVGAPHIRFYAGAKLTAATGEVLGILGVLDPRSRVGLAAGEAATLATLAKVVSGHFERRRQQLSVEAQLRVRTAELTEMHRLARFGTWHCSADLLGNIEWSDEIYEIMGRSRDNFVPTAESFMTCVHPDDRPYLKRINKALTKDLTLREYEFRVIRPSGEIRHCWSQAQPSHNLSDPAAPPGISGYCQDMTERKQIEQALLQSEKLHTMGALTGGVAHDFNNLLTVITLNLEEATASLSSDDSLQDMLQPAMHASLRGAELTKQLLSYAKRAPLRPQHVRLSALLTTLKPLLISALGQRHALEIVLNDDGCSLWVDPGRLESAILNLLLNARDAMPKGGEIVLEVRSEEHTAGAADEPRGPAPGHYVVISVRDQGTGIEPDVLARVFEPFFTTKESGKGSGLGLSMVFGFAKQSGGHTAIDSVVGQGTAVRLYLPTRAAELPEADAPATQPDWQGAGLRALVVEDQPAVLVAVSRMLTQMGFRVTEACTAEEAIEQVDFGGFFDLVLTDIVLPGPIDGVALSEKIRRQSPATQVMLSSGVPAQGVSCAPRDFLIKPYRRDDLYARLRILFPSR